MSINPLNAKLNPICHPLALLGSHHILHVSKVRVKANDAYVQGRVMALTETCPLFYLPSKV
jgi:hypothetical protein